MAKVIVFKSSSSQFAVIDAPDSYMTGQTRPATQSTDRYYDTKDEAIKDAKSRHGGTGVIVTDETAIG